MAKHKYRQYKRHCYAYVQTWRVYICIRVREKEKRSNVIKAKERNQEGRERSAQPEQLHPFDLRNKQNISQASQRNFFHFCFECCKLARHCIKPKKSVAPGLDTVLYAWIIMDFLIYALLYKDKTSKFWISTVKQYMHTAPVHLERNHPQSSTFPSALDNTRRIDTTVRQWPNAERDNKRGTYIERHRQGACGSTFAYV